MQTASLKIDTETLYFTAPLWLDIVWQLFDVHIIIIVIRMNILLTFFTSLSALGFVFRLRGTETFLQSQLHYNVL